MAGRLPHPAGLPKTVGRPTIFQSSQEKLAAGARKPGETWEENMRLLKLALAGVCVLGLAGTANSAEPVKIRMSWVAPVSNWASIVLEKKDLAKHLGKSYTIEPIRYQGTPQMITAIANNELEVSNLAYSSLAIAIENAGLERYSRHRRRISGRRARLLHARSTTSARTAVSTRSKISRAR